MTRKKRSDFRHESSVVREEVERRFDARGPVRDLEVELPGGERASVLEAGRRGVFVALEDPDRLALGAKLDVAIAGRGRRAAARVEVIRKEIDPRRGVALLIVHMSPSAAAELDAMLGA